MRKNKSTSGKRFVKFHECNSISFREITGTQLFFSGRVVPIKSGSNVVTSLALRIVELEKRRYRYCHITGPVLVLVNYLGIDVIYMKNC